MKFAIKKVYKDSNGKQVGYTVVSDNKTEVNIDISGLRDYFKCGKCVNAVLVSNSFVRGKSGNKLCFGKSSSSNAAKDSIADIYYGDELEDLIISSGVTQLKERDFVDNIQMHVNNQGKQIIGVSGLRGTGKTTGFLQAINKISDYKDSVVYLVIRSDITVTCRGLFNLLVNELNFAKYIFIDEVTRISNFTSESGILYDNFVLRYSKKLFICGTESLSLSLSRINGLYHRMILASITFISFTEAQRTMGFDLKQYMKMGGLYVADAFNDVNGLYDYVSTAVVDNIVNTLERNKSVSDIEVLRSISRDKLMRIIFLVLYSVIFTSLKINTEVRVSNVIGLFDLSHSLYDVETLNDIIRTQFGLTDRSIITEKEFNAVLQCLQRIGLLMRADNITKCDTSGNYQYCIANQCVTNVLYRELIRQIQNLGLNTNERAKNTGIKSVNGHVFEAIILAHVLKFITKKSGSVFYYHDNQHREIDLVIEMNNIDSDDLEYYLFEIKMTNDMETATIKASWLNDEFITSFFENRGTIVKRAIIYSGNSGIFKGFKSSDIYPMKGKSLAEIEEKNMNTSLISAMDFLINMGKYID